MEQFKINTDMFGELNISIAEGLFEEYTITLDNKKLHITLDIFDYTVTVDNLTVIEYFLNNVPEMYQISREEIIKNKDTNEVIRFFLESELECINEDALLKIFQVDSIKQINTELLIEKLELTHIFMSPYNSLDSGDVIECTFDFCLDKEYTDELLVMRFNEKLELVGIAHES